jgi:hypothetical protein
VAPSPPPPPSALERRKLLRDALRLTLWRATGSTGGWLVLPVARKRGLWGVGGGAANVAFRPRESRLSAVPAVGREGAAGVGSLRLQG